MLLKIKISWICKHSQKFIRLYGGLNISSITFTLVTPKTAKPAKNFSFEIFKLYGIYR